MSDQAMNHTPEEIELMERYAITFDGEKYQFDIYKYVTLKDTINYAKQQIKNDPDIINKLKQQEKHLITAKTENSLTDPDADNIKNMPIITRIK